MWRLGYRARGLGAFAFVSFTGSAQFFVVLFVPVAYPYASVFSFLLAPGSGEKQLAKHAPIIFKRTRQLSIRDA